MFTNTLSLFALIQFNPFRISYSTVNITNKKKTNIPRIQNVSPVVVVSFYFFRIHPTTSHGLYQLCVCVYNAFTLTHESIVKYCAPTSGDALNACMLLIIIKIFVRKKEKKKIDEKKKKKKKLLN